MITLFLVPAEVTGSSSECVSGLWFPQHASGQHSCGCQAAATHPATTGTVQPAHGSHVSVPALHAPHDGWLRFSEAYTGPTTPAESSPGAGRPATAAHSCPATTTAAPAGLPEQAGSILPSTAA